MVPSRAGAVTRAQMMGPRYSWIPMTDNDNLICRRDRLRDPLVEGGVFGRPLSVFPRLVLVSQMVEGVVRIDNAAAHGWSRSTSGCSSNSVSTIR
jgi:hypothetical protein